MLEIFISLTCGSLIIWIGLLTVWGNFWQNQPILETQTSANTPLESNQYPHICVIIPARNEAELIVETLRSHFCQDYPGRFSIILVDDGSSDRTVDLATTTAQQLHRLQDLRIITGKPLPAGWTGKLWAMHQGIIAAASYNPDYLLLTDADIQHHPHNLQLLVNQAENRHLDLVSVMVRLRCQGFWEKLLIPAFVFFFKKLYPFNWVNHSDKSTAAAAGGCILIRSATLTDIGGINTIRQALIDDCALAKAIKSQNHGQIWLGLSSSTISLRPYPDLSSIWNMVARTAFTQLNYSWLLLVGTVLGMTLVYLIAPLSLIGGILTANWLLAICGVLVWLLMAIAYFPTIRFYQVSPGLAITLPLIGLIYTLMTMDSAIRHFQGKGGNWKGRAYDVG